MNAQQSLPLTVTPLSLVHDREVVDSTVVLRGLEPEPPPFLVTAEGRPHDAMLSIALAPGLVRIELHEPERLVVELGRGVEHRLPPIVITRRHGAAVEPVKLLGHDWGEELRGPIWVRAGGRPTDLIVALGAARRASFPLDRDCCELSWVVGSRPRSLRLTVAGYRAQLILRPGRRD